MTSDMPIRIHPLRLAKVFKSNMDLAFPPYQKFVKLLYSQVA